MASPVEYLQLPLLLIPHSWPGSTANGLGTLVEKAMAYSRYNGANESETEPVAGPDRCSSTYCYTHQRVIDTDDTFVMKFASERFEV
jgi:hypothetical protein